MKKRNIDFGKFFNFFSILKHPAFITMSLILFIILYFLIPMNFFETDFYFNVSGTDNSIFQISDTETPYIFYILHKQAIYYEIILIILNVVYYFYIDEELDSSPEFFVPYVLLNVIVLIGAFLFAGIMYISSAEQLKLKRVFITPNGNLKTIIIGNKSFENPFYYDPIKHKLYIHDKNKNILKSCAVKDNEIVCDKNGTVIKIKNKTDIENKNKILKTFNNILKS